MDPRLSVSRVRLASLRMQGVATLKILASQFVIKNIGFYLDPQQDGRTQLTCLPETVRQCLLYELPSLPCDYVSGNEDAAEIRMKAAQLLLSAETRFFDVNWLSSFCPNTPRPISAERTLQLIATGATKISVVAYNYLQTCRWVDRAGVFNSDIRSALLKMSSLKELHLTKCPFSSLSEVLDICQSLPNLTHLEVSLLSENSEFDIPALRSSLKNLRVFIFKVFKRLEPLEEDKVERIRLAVACLQYLPKLEIVGHHATKYCKAHFTLRPRQLLESPCSLRHLAMDADNPFTPEQYQMLPNITDLKVKWNRFQGEIPGCQFAKVETLYLVNVPSEEIWLSFGHSCGQNLHTLNLHSIHLLLSFGEIFTLCPNLQNLTLFAVTVKDDTQLHDPCSKFANLKTITIKSPPENKMKLCNILSAPKLEEVYLSFIEFDKRDLLRMAYLVQHQHMFTQLTTIEFTPKKMKSGRYKALREFVLNICAFSPKLVEIHFRTFLIDKEDAAVLGSSDEDLSGGAEVDQIKDFISAAFK